MGLPWHTDISMPDGLPMQLKDFLFKLETFEGLDFSEIVGELEKIIDWLLKNDGGEMRSLLDTYSSGETDPGKIILELELVEV